MNHSITEVGVPDQHRISPARAQQWVITCVDDAAYDGLLIPFLGSLLSLAKWDGPIAIFDYGLSPSRVERLKDFGLLVEKVEHTHNIVCLDRFLHLASFAKRHPGLMGHWDCDIWFPGPVSDLFDNYLRHHPGKLVCNLDHVFQESNFRVAKTYETLDQLKEVLAKICQQHGNLLQCGFLFGEAQAIIGFGDYLEDFLKQEGIRTCWNTDTVGLNYYFHEQPQRIDIIDNRFNFLPDCLPYPLPDDFSVDALGIRGFHITSPWRNIEDSKAFLFQSSHPRLHQLWQEELSV